jgi:hypothetical protein
MHFAFALFSFFASVMILGSDLEQQPVFETNDTVCIVEEPRAAPYCYFHLPKGWGIAEARTSGSQVKMAFVKKTKNEGFCPSLNLAVEEVEGTLNEYLNDVKAIHEQDRKNHWRKLGKVHTLAGDAQLTEIDTFSQLGSVRMLQLILLKEGRAYIVTAAALKKDMSNYYRDFQDAFHSLTITDDLFEAIPQLECREAMKGALDKIIQTRVKNTTSETTGGQPISEEEFHKNHWIPFHDKIQEECEDMGLFWQTLVLEHASETIKNAFRNFSTDNN